MPNLTTPMALFASNYLRGAVWSGTLHLAVGVIGFALLFATLMLVLNAERRDVRRPRLATTRPALQH